MKQVLSRRICTGCREPFEGRGVRFAGRRFCNSLCIPTVLRDTYAELLDQRARDAGVGA